MRLRSFIKKELCKSFGENWWTECIPQGIKQKCEKLAESELKRGRKVEPIECLDFSHYKRILMKEPNWSKVFQRFFKNKEQLMARLTILKDIRDPVSHARGKITQKEKADVITSIQHLRKLMTYSNKL